jgi:hypothetical protein
MAHPTLRSRLTVLFSRSGIQIKPCETKSCFDPVTMLVGCNYSAIGEMCQFGEIDAWGNRLYNGQDAKDVGPRLSGLGRRQE